jgi:predicted CXXCH cytochrome family protein
LRIGIASVAALTLLLAVVDPGRAQTQVARTKHNLTSTGPGPIRGGEPAGTCIFCHTPHNANPTRGLWNRELPAINYQLYTSSSLQARVNQPTGSSRLCLSCHDGVLALANLRQSPPRPSLALGVLTGASSLGRDLSADHPVSIVYDSALAHVRGELVDPSALPTLIRLDDTRQLQCTSCHDPHEDRQPKFLRMDNRYGALCVACHRPLHWSGSAHAVSTARWNGGGTNPWPGGAFDTVAENGCLSCHRPHAAAHPQQLLNQPAESANCTVCHSGALAAKNIEAEFSKPLHHPIEASQGVHQPYENPLSMPRHVACVDCHNPHATAAMPGTTASVSGRLLGVAGVAIAGNPVQEARFEYEVCLKCHGLREPGTTGIVRQSGTRNIRLKIAPTNASFHPVAGAGLSATIRGLEPGYTASSIITCTSCHNNDEWTPSATAPSGPHGSRFEPILERQYQTNDPNIESAFSYDLCYKCHTRSYMINDPGRGFSHNKHVVGQGTPCAVCHDSHGSRQNAHLIDFVLRDRTGKSVVSRSRLQGRLEYISSGPGRGQCYLQCHGVNHEPKSYP